MKEINKIIRFIESLPKTDQTADAIYAISHKYNLDFMEAINLYNAAITEVQKHNNPLNIRMRLVKKYTKWQ